MKKTTGARKVPAKRLALLAATVALALGAGALAGCAGQADAGIGDFMMDGENDLLSVHVKEFEDAGDEVDCVLCHEATVNGTAMTFAEMDNDGLCMGCHDIEEVADATENWNGTDANPHRLNHGVFECTSCHTMHTGEQTYYCNKCHHFELPEGWVSPDYISDSQPFESF